MHIEYSQAHNHTAINAALSTTALILGSYSLYTLLKKTPSSYSGSWQENISKVATIAKYTPISIASALFCAGSWNLSVGESISSSRSGVAALSLAYTFPTAVITFGILDQWRLYDEPWFMSKSVATTFSVACAASIVASDKNQMSSTDLTTLAVTTTFPVALTFFNYRAINRLEEDDTVVAKAISASVVVGGAVSLISSIRPGYKI